ncbi:MAG: DUF485 domain-containing protein [Bifidobacteriaceae bacterium]|jgi:uncharacterized membrane protein (DUF485 family)|nr:DUF485 domain-containing protein [Bifidobacteriaceae bacterium]
MADQDTRPGPTAGAIDYLAVDNSPQFQDLRQTQRGFVLPVVAVSLVWYLVYVLAASWATDFMSTPVIGNVNWGIVLGLAQIATTFAFTMWYVGFADRKLDPAAAEIRHRIEAELEAPK